MQVSEQMASQGHIRTAKQCREKLKKLKSDYRAVKDHIARSSADGRSGSGSLRDIGLHTSLSRPPSRSRPLETVDESHFISQGSTSVEMTDTADSPGAASACASG
ncbi:uncharacterized protein KZ484_015007 [Pholidichthys leucotaenia]